MQIVEQFEAAIAEFYNAPYAVATDCCTHAIELCLRYNQANTVTCPAHTYLSVPFTFEKLGLTWEFTDLPWQDYYYIGNTNIVDAAVYWKKDGYIPFTKMCLSFQFKKHLNLGRGGAILLDNLQDYRELKKMAHDGREPNRLWKEQAISSIGYHYYMPYDTAAAGLEKLPIAAATPARTWTFEEYPDLRTLPVFQK